MSSGRPGEKVVHQDYIARIRYSNALPPPPNPPKLLDIPGTGLSSGQYTSAGYSSRLARDQPLNIEADAELGMPIDLIGIPGIFEGKEEAISARPNARELIHPADRALLKPLHQLGKANASQGAVSFLRRTEYSSSQQAQHFSSSTSKDLVKLRNDNKRRKPSLNKDDPINIMRHIVKGFDIAYPQDAYKGEDSTENLRGAQVADAELKAWSHPKHPSYPDLKLLDSYPILPDPDAIPSVGFYMVMKYQSNPSDIREKYDERLDTALMRPVADERAEDEYQEKLKEWQESNSSKPEPIREYDYDYYLPADVEAVQRIKRRLDVNDPEKDDDTHYTDDNGEGARCFKYRRIRTYETSAQNGDRHNLYNSSLALALHDADASAHVRLAKGAYFYPIVQRTSLRSKRNTQASQTQYAAESKIDELNVVIGDARIEAAADE
ncbi:hypothetical protein BST61_g1979 [Cercospora zeina]